MLQWKSSWSNLVMTTDDITSFIRVQSSYSPILERKTFTLHSLGRDLVNYIDFESLEFGNKNGEKEYQKWIQMYLLDERIYDLEGKKFIDRLKYYTNKINEDVKDIDLHMVHAKEFFESLNMRVNPRKKGRYPKQSTPEERAYLHFIFFAYVHRFEAHLREAAKVYPSVYEDLSLEKNEMNQLFGKRNKLFRLLPTAATGTRFGYRLAKRDGDYRLKVLRYYGNTRLLLTQSNELLKGSGKYRLKNDYVKTKGPCIIGLSGTSYAPGSPHFDVPMRPVRRLINRLEPPAIECFKAFVPSEHVDYDYGYVSGTYGFRRELMLRELTRMYDIYFESELAFLKEHRENRKLLVIVNSYHDARIVADEMSKKPKWNGRFRFLTRSEDSLLRELESLSIHRSRIEQASELGVDILIAPLSVIARGYNILQCEPGKTHRSYFGSACLFIRPYYVVDDMKNIFSLLHGYMDEIMNKLSAEKKIYSDYVKNLYQAMNTRFRYLIAKPMIMNGLNLRELEELCWMTLILVQQLLGRLMRGDTPARLLIADAKMDCIYEEKIGKVSMIDVWLSILKQHEKNDVIQDLYGSFYKGLQQIQDYPLDDQ